MPGLDEEQTRLARRLGPIEATAVALGAMIGAGVYISMAEAARTTGGSLVLAVLLGAIVATLNGLSAAELGADDPRAGGAYQFASRLVSPLVGFVAGWLFLLAGLTASATYALTFSAYLVPLLPTVSPRGIGTVLILAAVALNALGVRLSARISLVLVSVNLAVLIAFVVLTLPVFDPGRLQPLFTGGLSGLLQASALLFFAYTGYARPVTIAEEVQEPRRTLPLAVTTALGVTLVLYLGVAVGALGALGPARLGRAPAPLRSVMLALDNPAGALLISLGALLATATVLLTEIWGLSRLAFAMARTGDLPAWLGRLAAPERIPRNALLAVGALLLVLASALDLRPALEASSLALLVYYGIMSLSALQLPPGRRLYPPAIPAAGLVANTLIALALPWQTILAVLGVAAAGLAYSVLRRRR